MTACELMNWQVWVTASICPSRKQAAKCGHGVTDLYLVGNTVMAVTCSVYMHVDKWLFTIT